MMDERRVDPIAAAREAQFLAALRSGSAPPRSRGLFDATAADEGEQMLRVVTACPDLVQDPGERAPAQPAGAGWLLPNLLWRLAWQAWRFTRQLSGDDAYERYLEHVARFHPGRTPMTRAEHYAFMQAEKWNRLSRCC